MRSEHVSVAGGDEGFGSEVRGKREGKMGRRKRVCWFFRVEGIEGSNLGGVRECHE